MKNFKNLVSPFHWLHLPERNNFRQMQRFVFMSMPMLTLCFSSCFMPYYKTNTTMKISPAAIEHLISDKKHFILHTIDGPFVLKAPQVENDALRGTLAQIPPDYERYLNPKTDKANLLHPSQAAIVCAQVHIYTNNAMDSSGNLMLPISQIFRMDVYQKDKATTVQSRIGSIVAIGLGLVAIGYIASHSMNFNSGGFNIHL